MDSLYLDYGWWVKLKWVGESVVQLAKGLEGTYVALGLGLMLVSSKFSDSVWVSLLLLVSGVVFVGAGIGKLIGTGGTEVIEVNAKIGVVFGFPWLIAGVVVSISRFVRELYLSTFDGDDGANLAKLYKKEGLLYPSLKSD